MASVITFVVSQNLATSSRSEVLQEDVFFLRETVVVLGRRQDTKLGIRECTDYCCTTVLTRWKWWSIWPIHPEPMLVDMPSMLLAGDVLEWKRP